MRGGGREKNDPTNFGIGDDDDDSVTFGGNGRTDGETGGETDGRQSQNPINL